MAEKQEVQKKLGTLEMADRLTTLMQNFESAQKAKENLAGRNEFVRGVVRGTDQLQATYQGGMGMVNALVGNDAEAARRFSNYQNEMRQSTENPATVDKFFSNDPKSGAMASAGNMATWAAGTAGSLIPSVAESVVSGVAGGVAGGMLVPGPDPTDVATVPVGALAGMFGKGVVKKAIAEAAEQYVKQGVKREAAEQMATQAVRNTIAKRTGATVAAQQTTALNEGGGIYMEGREKGYDNPASAMALGQISGASEVAFGVFPASLRMVFGKAGVSEVAKKSGLGAAAGYAWDIAKNSAEEGVQEAFQEGLGSINESINDPKAKLFTKENFIKWAESAAAGALGGGMFGVGGAAASAYQNRGQQSQTPPGEIRDTVSQNAPTLPPTQPAEAPTYNDVQEDPIDSTVAQPSLARAEKLKEVISKGYVSEDDGAAFGIPGRSRKERLANAKAELDDLEAKQTPITSVPNESEADAFAAQEVAKRRAAKSGVKPPIEPTAPTPPIASDSQQATPAVQGVDWNAIATAGTELLPSKAKEKGWSDEELAKTKSEIEGLAVKATQGDVEAQDGLIAIAKELETEELAKPSSEISDTVSQNEKVPPVELQPKVTSNNKPVLQLPFLTPEWRANREKEIATKPGQSAPNGEKQRAAREAVVKKQVDEEIALMETYPPGTELEVSGLPASKLKVLPDGRMQSTEATSTRIIGENAGAVLRGYKPEQIKVVSTPNTEAPLTPVAAPTVPPTKKPIRKEPAAPTPPRTMEPTEEGRPADGKPVMPGDRFLTNTKRETTPYPKYDGSTNRKAIAGEKKSQEWLIDNAIAEAESRGDEYNARMFRNELEDARRGKLPQASKDSATLYVFGDYIPKVPKSILKDVSTPESKNSDTVSQNPKPETTKGGDPNGKVETEGQTKAQTKTEAQADADDGLLGSKGDQATGGAPSSDSSVRKAIAENGGYEKNSADDVEAIRRKLYDGDKTPSHADIRAVMQEMKNEAGQKPVKDDGKPKPPKGYKALKEFTPESIDKMAPGAIKRTERESKDREEGLNAATESRLFNENFIKIVADDVSKIRKQDVYRLLSDVPKERSGNFENWLIKRRPDLAEEVNTVSTEILQERANQSPTPDTGLDEAALEAMIEAEFDKQLATKKPITKSVEAEPKTETKPIEFTEIKKNKIGVSRTVNAFDGNKLLTLELNKNQGSWSIREQDKSNDIVEGIVDFKKAKNVAARILEGTFDPEGDDRFVKNDNTNIAYSNTKLAERVPLGGRQNFASTLKTTGFFTDGVILLKVSDKDRDAILAKLPEPGGARALNVARFIEDSKKAIRFKDNEFSVVGYRGGDVTDRTVFLRNSNGGFAIVDKAYHDTILQKYPTAKFWGDAERYKAMTTGVSYSVDDEFVAVVMPLQTKRIAGRLKSMVEGTYVFNDQPEEAPKPKRPIRKPKTETKLEQAADKARKEADDLWEEFKIEGSGKLLANLDSKLAGIAVRIAIAELKAESLSFAAFVERAVSKIPATMLEKAKPYMEMAWKIAYKKNMTSDPGGKFDDYLKQNAKPDAEPKPNSSSQTRIAKRVSAALENGEALTGPSFFAIADEEIGGKRSNNEYGDSEATDALELGVNMYFQGKTNANVSPQEAKDTLEQIKKAMQLVPRHRGRTGNKEIMQQFSTPPAYAYAVNWIANVSDGDVVLEPSAGMGGLAIHAANSGATVYANELDENRAKGLRELPMEKVFTEDAEQIGAILAGKTPGLNVIVMNPPFSRAGTRMGDKMLQGTDRKHVDEALLLLPDGGRLVAIVGAGRDGQGKKMTQWLDDLPYKLTANIEVAREVYRGYGTEFPTRVLVIDKVPRVNTKTITGLAGDLDQLIDIAKEVRDARQNASVESTPNQQDGEQGTNEDGDGTRSSDDARDTVDPGVPEPEQQGSQDRQPTNDRGDGDADAHAGTGTTVRNSRGGRRGGGGGGSSRKSRSSGGKGKSSSSSAGKPNDALRGGLTKFVAKSRTKTVGKKGELTDSTFEVYIPTIAVEGARPHPAPIVESAAMAAVDAPRIEYEVDLMPGVFEGYVNDDNLYVGISDIQLEAIALAGAAHEQLLSDGTRRGFLIGDGTGVGKAREALGIIMDDLIKRGVGKRRRAVFITKNDGLVKDAVNEWVGVGGDPSELHPLSDVGSGEAVDVASGVLTVSYDTLKGDASITARAAGKQLSRVDQIVDWVGEDFDGVIVFDEAHLMANSLDSGQGSTRQNASQRALAGVDLQKRLPNARFVYLSATAATEVRNLAYAERLGLWGPGTEFTSKYEFINEIEAGGVAAMEKVAADMKAMGMYTARNLSFDDGTENGRVEFDRITHTLSDDQRRIYDKLSEAWLKVLQNIDAALELTDNAKGKSRIISAFWSSNQRFWNDVISSMMAPTLITNIEKDLKEGKSVILQLYTTKEAATNRAIAGMKEGQTYDEIDASPRRSLMEFVEKSFPTQRHEEYTDESGNVRTRPVVDSEGKAVHDPKAMAMKEKLLDEIGSLDVASRGPMDIILDHFGRDMVAEVSGRSQRLVKNEEGLLELEKRGKAASRADRESFMDGRKRILMFSEAGGTGASYHASLSAQNQQRRSHYLWQPGWSATTAVQGLGRAHRSNQASAPKLHLLEPNLEGYKRFISTVARRLAQLGALTKGQRTAADAGLFGPGDNLESTESSRALSQFLLEALMGRVDGIDKDFLVKRLGFEQFLNPQADPTSVPIPQFLNRILNLPLGEQNRVFKAFVERFDALVAEAVASGTLDQGMETLKAVRIVKSKETVVNEHPSGAKTKLVELVVTKKQVVLSFDDMMQERARYGSYQPRGFVISKTTGRISAVMDQMRISQDEKGRTTHDAMLIGVNGNSYGTSLEQLDNRQYWEQVSNIDSVRDEWEKQASKSPKTVDIKWRLLTGALLPVWKKISSGERRVWRAKTEDGEMILGRYLSEESLAKTMEKLGVSGDYADAKKLAPKEAVQAIYEGHTVELVNGWQIKKRSIDGEDNIEITGPDYSSAEAITNAGGFSRRIDYTTRFFIPFSDSEGLVLSKVAKISPIKRIAYKKNAKNDLDNSIRRLPDTLYQTDDVNPSVQLQALDIALAAEDAGIQTFDQLIAYSVKTVGERRTREIGEFFRAAAKAVELKGIRPVGDILGVPGVTREQAEAVAKAAFGDRLSDEEVSAGIDVVERLGLLDNIGFAPFGSQVPTQGLFQKSSPKWYYKSRDLIQDKMGPKATSDQVLGMLRKNGVNEEELYWSGLEELLGSQQSVTKDEVLAAIDNGARVEEVITGGSSGDWVVYNGSENEYFDTKQKAIDYAKEIGAPSEDLFFEEKTLRGATKYSQYTTPGGENYKELLITLPGQRFWIDGSPITAEDLSTQEGREAADRVGSYGNSAFESSHWDQPNVLVHLRMNERTDADGKKVLFLEEVQSDWHQEGRKKGYQETENQIATRLRTLDLRPVEVGNRRWQIKNKEGDKVVTVAADDSVNAIDKYARLIFLKSRDQSGRVPDAPFKKSWSVLAMKRAIQYAAENGFDRIAWATGEQQAERYDLSKQVDSIQWSEKHQRLVASKMGKAVIDEKGVTSDKLEDFIGKEAAKKLLEQPDVPFQWASGSGKALDGDNLKVGGEGMKAFYDKMLPNEVNKLVKKFGAKVGFTRITVPGKDRVVSDNEFVLDEFKDGLSEVNSFDITTAMRESAMTKGQTLFQNQTQGGNVKGWTSFISATRAIIGATNKADVSTFIHEIAHPMRRFLLNRKVPQSKRADITDAEILSLENVLGVKDGDWKVEHEEKFAKMWERYWFEGKPPKNASPELESLFKKIAQWMSGIYKAVQQISKPLPQEVRDLFDKLVQRNEFRDTVSQNENRDTVSQTELLETTSIKNEKTNARRFRDGIPALADVATETQDEWLDAADEMLRDDPMVGDRLVKEINTKARNLSNVEVAVMQIHYRGMNNRLEKVSDRLFAAKNANDAAESAKALIDVDIVMNALAEIEEATKAAGREWGRAGVARQIELNKDFSRAAIMRKARIANGGNALSEKQLEDMNALARRVADLEGKLAKAVQEKLDLERRKNVEAQIEDSKGNVQPVPESIRKKVLDRVNAFKTKFASKFASSGKTDSLFATEDEDMADEAKSVIQEYVNTMGVSSLGELLANLRKDLGSDIPVSVQSAFTTAWKDMSDNGDIPVPMVDKSDVRGLSRLAKQIERSLVEAGITELNEVVQGVHESLQEIIPDITRRETMDAMSGYGQYSAPSENPDDKIIADINGRLLELAKLDDMNAGIAPARTGVGRQEKSDEHRELIRKVNLAKREGNYRVTDPDTQLKSAVGSAITALTNRIHDLNKAIRQQTPIVSGAKTDLAGQNDKVVAMRKERDELTAIYKTLFPKPGATMEQRIAATAKALDRVADSLEKQMETRNFETKKKAEPISTEELDAKRARIDALRAQREDIAEFKEWNEERKSKAYKANLLKQIADYKDRALHGFYGPKPRKEVRTLSKEEVALGLELQKVKDEFFRLAGLYRLEHMSPRERAWDYTKETAHLSRALMTSLDFSAVFRQGGAVVFSHPKMAAETSKDMYKAMWSAASEFETAEKMRRDDMYQFAMTADLSLTAEDGKITRQEEAFLGRWAKRIGLIAGSARGYTTFMNGIRFALFKHMVANLGKGGQVTLDEAKVIAFYINAATGRSDLGPMMKWAEQANMLFFAPRFVASRFQYLGMPLWLLGSRKVSGRVKKAIAMEYIRHSAGIGSFLALTVALGALLGGDDEDEKPTVSLDPRSSDFLKIKLGETRIDPMSGLSQVITLMGRIASGQRVGADGTVVDLRGEAVPYGGLGMAGTVGNFVRTKFAPVPGAAFDIATGENVVGQDVTPFSSIVNLFIPLSLREIQDTAQSRGIPQGALISLMSLHGMGSSTYGPESNFRKGTPEIREKQFKKDIRKMTFDSKDPKYKSLLSEEQMTQVEERRENRKQGLVFSASAHPIRKEYRDDESYNKAVSERDASLENLKKSGLTLKESRKLLIDHWGSSYGSVYEMRKGVRVYKEALSDRLRQLRKAFQQ